MPQFQEKLSAGTLVFVRARQPRVSRDEALNLNHFECLNFQKEELSYLSLVFMILKG